MEHPVTKSRISLLIYWLFPLTAAVAQGGYNSYYHILSMSVAFQDSIIFSAVLGILGIATWYVVRYNDPEKSGSLQMLASHVAASVVFIGLWIISSGILVKTMIGDATYKDYLNGQLSGRIFAGILTYALLVSIYYIYVYSQRNREKELREAQWKDQIRKAQLNALKSQINPHFLFNSLNSIASLTLTDPGKAHGMVIALSDFMRYSLHNHQDDMVPLNVELKNIELYLQIEKIRFGDKLNYHFHIGEGCGDHLIPNLILQPVFENAIKYGVYEASDPVEIILEAKYLADCLEIIVTNDFDPDSVTRKGEGVGLNNISDRLRIIYGSSRLLTAELGDKRFKVKLIIPDK